MTPDYEKLTDYGRMRLEEMKSEYDSVVGEELFWNTRLPNDGTLKD